MHATRVPTPSQSNHDDTHKAIAQQTELAGYAASPMTLAKLDFGLFRALRRLDTSREKICFALCISESDYEYLTGLTGV